MFSKQDRFTLSSFSASLCLYPCLMERKVFFKMDILKNGPHPAFFHLFSSFQTKITIFTTKICEKCPSSIWCWVLNSQPLGHEFPPITSRQGFPSLKWTFSFLNGCTKSGNVMRWKARKLGNEWFAKKFEEHSAETFLKNPFLTKNTFQSFMEKHLGGVIHLVDQCDDATRHDAKTTIPLPTFRPNLAGHLSGKQSTFDEQEPMLETFFAVTGSSVTRLGEFGLGATFKAFDNN